MAKDRKIDVVTMHLINNLIYSLVDEMSAVVVRTSFSPLARDAFDFQCGLCKANGEIIMEGEGTLVHSLAYAGIIEAVQKKYGDAISPGDTFIDNDPYTAASHLPDVYLARPIFLDGKLVAWSLSGGHQTDVGGKVAGSCACDATEIYQEGLRIPPVKLFEKDAAVQDIIDIMRANSRTPDWLIGDVTAHFSACYTGEKRFIEIAKAYGWETLSMYIDELLDYAEGRTREELRKLPEGTYEFTDYMDDSGFGEDLIPIHVKITIDGDTIIFDFTGTSPQVKGAINNPFATTKAMVLIGFRLLLSPDIPRNSGVWRAVKLIVPEGTVLNPTLPAPVAARGVTLSRIIDAMMGAEAKIMPDKIPACEVGPDCLVCLGAKDKENKLSIVVETIWGGWGGRPFADGVEYNTPILLDGSNQSCELNEELYPFRYNQNMYVCDTGGAGKYRGSSSIVRDWEFIGDEGTLQLRVDRLRTRPWGLHGGHPGVNLKAFLNPGRDNISLGKVTVPLKKGDVLSVMTAGAGGWGNPLERDVQMVLSDVLNEKVSIEQAKKVYGVLIDRKSMEVNKDETVRLRYAMRKERDVSSGTKVKVRKSPKSS